MILTGPNIASHGPLFEQIATRIYHEEGIGPVVVLSSKDATNLKNTLKKLIKDATQESQGLDDEDDIGPTTTSAQKVGYMVPGVVDQVANFLRRERSF